MVVCILKGGNEYLILMPGKVVNFEWHPLHGPTVLDREGNPAKNNQDDATRFGKMLGLGMNRDVGLILLVCVCGIRFPPR